MKKYLSFFITLAALLLGLSCQNEASQQKKQAMQKQVIETESKRLTTWLNEVYDAEVDRHPAKQAYLGIKKRYDSWNDISDAFAVEEIEILKRQLAQMKADFDLTKLDPQAQLSYRLFENEATRKIQQFPFRHHNYPVNQHRGLHTTIPSFLINIHKIEDYAQAKAYIARLEKVYPLIDQLIINLELRKEKGIILPKFLFPKIIEASKNVISGAPFDKNPKPSPIFKDFTDKVTVLRNMDENTKNKLIDQASSVLRSHVAVAYKKLITYLEKLEEQATDEIGVWKFPDGEQFYKNCLSNMTTTDLSPNEIFDLGNQEIQRIHIEMENIMKTVDFEGDLHQFFTYMETNKRFYYPNTQQGKEAYLQRTHEIIDSMRPKLADLFTIQPKAQLEVKAVEAFREKSAGKAFYQRPAPDGSRPGTYYVNLYDMGNMPNYQMETLAYHEAIPGHHMQISLAQEMADLPKFRSYDSDYTAYTEGWGLYSEYLPKEYGFYSDPYSDFGRLAAELWRACRLVADVGIHHKKWTREQAIEFYEQMTPNPSGDCIKMVDRHIVMPAQATTYKIGQLKFLALRQKAEQQMGDRFDIRTFHDVLLGSGAVPLDVLEELVVEYINK